MLLSIFQLWLRCGRFFWRNGKRPQIWGRAKEALAENLPGPPCRLIRQASRCGAVDTLKRIFWNDRSLEALYESDLAGPPPIPPAKFSSPAVPPAGLSFWPAQLRSARSATV